MGAKLSNPEGAAPEVVEVAVFRISWAKAVDANIIVFLYESYLALPGVPDAGKENVLLFFAHLQLWFLSVENNY